MYMIKIWIMTVAGCPFSKFRYVGESQGLVCLFRNFDILVIAQWDKLGFNAFKAHVPRSFVKCRVAD